MYFVIRSSSSWRSDCVILSPFKQQSLDFLQTTPKCPVLLFFCFFFFGGGVLAYSETLKFLNQVRLYTFSNTIMRQETKKAIFIHCIETTGPYILKI